MYPSINPFVLFVSIVFLQYIATTITVVDALPTGSPVCTVGEAAPGSLHLERDTIVTGNIELENFQIKIGNKVLSSEKVNRIRANTEFTFNLTSTTGVQFKGVLIILNKEGVDLSSNLSPLSTTQLYQPQDDCFDMGYSGMTHISRDLKSVALGTIIMPANTMAYLDVNIVLANNFVVGSKYYYTRFQLSTVVAPTPVKAPVPAPVRVPVKTPVRAPVKAPVRAPVKAPVRAPVKAPIRAPVKSPLRAGPVRAPVKAPVRSPIM